MSRITYDHGWFYVAEDKIRVFGGIESDTIDVVVSETGTVATELGNWMTIQHE